MGWRFYPLAEYPRAGILMSPERKPFAAKHLTLEEARPQAKGSQPLSRIDRFAEHLSNGLSVRIAAERVGSSPHYGNSMLQRIRRGLGPQAA